MNKSMMFKTLNFTFAGEKAALKKYKANVIGRKTNIKNVLMSGSIDAT